MERNNKKRINKEKRMNLGMAVTARLYHHSPRTIFHTSEDYRGCSSNLRLLAYSISINKTIAKYLLHVNLVVISEKLV